MSKVLTLRNSVLFSSSRKAKMCRQSHCGGRGRSFEAMVVSKFLGLKVLKRHAVARTIKRAKLTHIHLGSSQEIISGGRHVQFFPFYSERN